jgi:hypothetical protein
MSESHAESAVFHTIAAGDVYAFDTPFMPLVLLVMCKDEEVFDAERGAKVYFRWLAHHEADKVTACDWMYESSLRLMSVWQKVAAAR